MDFMILIGYPPDPPDHLNNIPIKKNLVFLSIPHRFSLSLSLPFTLLRLTIPSSQALSQSVPPQSSLSAALSLPPSVSGSSAYGGHDGSKSGEVKNHRSGEISPDLWFLTSPDFVDLCVDFFLVVLVIFLLLLC